MGAYDTGETDEEFYERLHEELTVKVDDYNDLIDEALNEINELQKIINAKSLKIDEYKREIELIKSEIKNTFIEPDEDEE